MTDDFAPYRDIAHALRLYRGKQARPWMKHLDATTFNHGSALVHLLGDGYADNVYAAERLLMAMTLNGWITPINVKPTAAQQFFDVNGSLKRGVNQCIVACGFEPGPNIKALREYTMADDIGASLLAVRHELQPMVSTYKQVRDYIIAQPCETPAQYEHVQAQLVICTQQLAALEAKRKAITQPLNTVKRNIDALFEPAKAPLEECAKHMRTQVNAYRAREREAEQASLKTMQLAHAQADYGAIVAAAENLPERTAVQGVSFRKAWAWEITDIKALPERYLELNASRVREHIAEAKAQGVDPSLPGLRFYEQESATIRK